MLFYFYAIISHSIKTIKYNCFSLQYHIAIIEQLRYIKGTKGEEAKMEKDIHFKIQSELLEKLKQKAKEMNISIASVARIAITEYLKKGG